MMDVRTDGLSMYHTHELTVGHLGSECMHYIIGSDF
jgi:hypothetical protein